MMRSDFYSLPWAAQMAIRRGQREARAASVRSDTIEQLDDERQTLIEALQRIITAHDAEAGVEYAAALANGRNVLAKARGEQA